MRPALFAAVAAGLAVALLVPGRPAHRRLATMFAATRTRRGEGIASSRESGQGTNGQRAAALTAGMATAVVLGWPFGVLAPVVALGVLAALARFEPVAVRRRRERLEADMPVALDLVAACLLAGASPYDAVTSTGRALGGPAGDQLAGVAHALHLGLAPADAWATIVDGPLRPAARSFARAMQTGAPMAEVAERLAADARDAARDRASAAARRAGVRAVAPLGVCFLPAFLLVAVVPVVAGLAAEVLG